MQTFAADTRSGNPTPAASARRFPGFAWVVLAYNVAVILWGALVRATRSGAGCGGHWPLCNGEVLPQTPAIATTIELTHRMMSGAALIAVVALFVWARTACRPGHPARRWAAWSLGFMLMEVLLGAALVLLGHVAANESVGRVYSLSAHLVNTFLLLASLALTAWYSGPHHANGRSQETRLAHGFSLASALKWLLPLLAIVIVAVAGAITALGDTLFPANTVAQGMREDFESTASFLVRLRVIHPLLAIGAAGFLGFLAGIEYRMDRTPRVRRLAQALLALIVCEILAGAANILLRAPLPLQLLHLFLADCLWITLVLFTSERLHAAGRRPSLVPAHDSALAAPQAPIAGPRCG
jgi:cytochrome c oxidase assembly protein subunit 15